MLLLRRQGIPTLLCCACQAVHLGIHIWLMRVASEDNVADLPSREDYRLMRMLSAKWREPRLAKSFVNDLVRRHAVAPIDSCE